jgi:hypothetical protein
MEGDVLPTCPAADIYESRLVVQHPSFFLLSRFTISFSSGSIALQGPHQNPQKSKTTTLPLYSERLKGLSSWSVPYIFGATMPIARFSKAKSEPFALRAGSDLGYSAITFLSRLIASWGFYFLTLFPQSLTRCSPIKIGRLSRVA